MNFDHRAIALHWADLLASAYGDRVAPTLDGAATIRLAARLADVVEKSVILAHFGDDQADHDINVCFSRWEAIEHRQTGPRLVRLSLAAETVTMA